MGQYDDHFTCELTRKVLKDPARIVYSDGSECLCRFKAKALKKRLKAQKGGIFTVTKCPGCGKRLEFAPERNTREILERDYARKQACAEYMTLESAARRLRRSEKK